MTDPHVQVRQTDLVAHARTVAGIGDRVLGAARGGQAVRAGPEAYGRLCTMVPAALGVLQDVLLSGIRSAGQVVHETGDRLQGAALAYESADRRRAAAFQSIPGSR